MLTANQKEAIEKLKMLKVGALFMKQGTGKTRTALVMVNSAPVEQALFVCPCSVKSTLQAEIKKWGCNVPYRIIGYETLANSDTTYLETLEYVKKKNTFIIADESIFIKNETAKRYKRMMELSRMAEYKLILNGTPITNNEWDVYNQMEFLSPKIINMGREEFLQSFFTKIKYKKRNQSAREFYKLSEVNIDYLRRLIRPYIYECDLQLDISERKKTILIEASEDNNERYNYCRERLLYLLTNGLSCVEQFINMAVACYDCK